MSKIIRFLSGRWAENPYQQQKKISSSTTSTFCNNKQNNFITCRVFFLDGSEKDFVLLKRSNGSVLLEKVFVHLDLIEIHYFGLLLVDFAGVQKWLEWNKQIRRQFSSVSSASNSVYTLNFKVRFYSSQPTNLKEEITRYYLFLQVREDLLRGNLECPHDLACQLAGLSLQSDFGDYDDQVEPLDFQSLSRFFPGQTSHSIPLILQNYQASKGMSPCLAELTFLNKVRWTETYGVDFHVVKGKDGNDYKLGLVPLGILIFEQNSRIGLFYWQKITRLDFKKKKVILNVVERDENDQEQEHTFVFRCQGDRECKQLWKRMLEHHCFFRLSGPSKPVEMKRSIITIGSRFRGSGTTELQSLTSVRARKTVHFERKLSRKFSGKQKFMKPSTNLFPLKNFQAWNFQNNSQQKPYSEQKPLQVRQQNIQFQQQNYNSLKRVSSLKPKLKQNSPKSQHQPPSTNPQLNPLKINEFSNNKENFNVHPKTRVSLSERVRPYSHYNISNIKNNSNHNNMNGQYNVISSSSLNYVSNTSTLSRKTNICINRPLSSYHSNHSTNQGNINHSNNKSNEIINLNTNKNLSTKQSIQKNNLINQINKQNQNNNRFMNHSSNKYISTTALSSPTRQPISNNFSEKKSNFNNTFHASLPKRKKVYEPLNNKPIKLPLQQQKQQFIQTHLRNQISTNLYTPSSLSPSFHPQNMRSKHQNARQNPQKFEDLIITPPASFQESKAMNGHLPHNYTSNVNTHTISYNNKTTNINKINNNKNKVNNNNNDSIPNNSNYNYKNSRDNLMRKIKPNGIMKKRNLSASEISEKKKSNLKRIQSSTENKSQQLNPHSDSLGRRTQQIGSYVLSTEV